MRNLFRLVMSLVLGTMLWSSNIQSVLGEGNAEMSAEVTSLLTKMKDKDPVTRAYAACTLGQLGHKATLATPELLALLRDGTHLEWRKTGPFVGSNPVQEETSPAWEAAKALIKIGGVEPFIIGLQNQDSNTVFGVLVMLSSIFAECRGDRVTDLVRPVSSLETNVARLVPPITDVLKSQTWRENADIRVEALSALAQILHLDNPSLASQDVQQTYAPDGSIRGVAERTALPAIIPILLSDAEPESVRIACTYALGMIGSPLAVDALKKVSSAKSARLRKYAADNLDKIIPVSPKGKKEY